MSGLEVDPAELDEAADRMTPWVKPVLRNGPRVHDLGLTAAAQAGDWTIGPDGTNSGLVAALTDAAERGGRRLTLYGNELNTYIGKLRLTAAGYRAAEAEAAS